MRRLSAKRINSDKMDRNSVKAARPSETRETWTRECVDQDERRRSGVSRVVKLRVSGPRCTRTSFQRVATSDYEWSCDAFGVRIC